MSIKLLRETHSKITALFLDLGNIYFQTSEGVQSNWQGEYYTITSDYVKGEIEWEDYFYFLEWTPEKPKTIIVGRQAHPSVVPIGPGWDVSIFVKPWMQGYESVGERLYTKYCAYFPCKFYQMQFFGWVFEPLCYAVADSEHRIYVCEKGSHKIKVLEPQEKTADHATKVPATQKYVWHEFQNPCSLFIDKQSLFVADDVGLHRLNLATYAVKTIARGKADIVTVNDNGKIFVARKNRIFVFRSEWKLERLLWIGYMKNSPNWCLLATLPREMIQELVWAFRGSFY